MITIEEKLNLFTKIVYDKVEKQNTDIINKFNQECGFMIHQKTEEFTKQAELIEKQVEKETEKEKLQILSKARIDGKKLIVGKNDKIFNDALQGVLQHAKGFANTEQYGTILIKEIETALNELDGSTYIKLYLTENDAHRYKEKVEKMFHGRSMEIVCDNSLVGGFIIIDTERSLKIDMSYLDRVSSAKDLIGERLVEILQ